MTDRPHADPGVEVGGTTHDPTFLTLGEQFIGLQLEKEQRAGVDHYVVGQAHARLQGPPESGMAVARLAYVSPLGLVVLVLVSANGQPWEPVGGHARVLGLEHDYGMRALPANFELSAEMLKALKEIEPAEEGETVHDWVREIAGKEARERG